MLDMHTWKIVPLKDVLTLVRNGTTREQNQESQGDPVTRIETISTGIIDTKKVGWIKNARDIISDYKLQVGDILFSHINSYEHLGKCAIYNGSPENLFHGMNLLLLRCDKLLIEPYFLLYFLRSPIAIYSIRARAGRAVNQVSINQSSLETLRIPLPPLPEQRRIAAILREADEIRKLRKRANEKVKSLYKILFHSCFGKDLVALDDTKYIKLKELLAVPLTSGFSPEGKDTPPGIPVFVLSAVTDAGLDENQVKYYPVDNYRGKGDDLQVDDILITRSNTVELVGKVARYLGMPSPVIYPDLTIRIRLKSAEDSKYVENFLRSDLMQLTIQRIARGTSGSMKKISQGDINEFEILWPAEEERQNYAKVVEEIDKQKQLQKASLSALDTLYQSLLSQAFTGELTATWREAHAIELAQAAQERDLLLGNRLPKPIVYEVEPALPAQPEVLITDERSTLLETLSPLQSALYHLMQKRKDIYFAATKLHSDVQTCIDEYNEYHVEQDAERLYQDFAGLNCSLDTLRRELRALAMMGLAREAALSVEDEDAPDTVRYVTVYRFLQVDDDCQHDDLVIINPETAQEVLV